MSRPAHLRAALPSAAPAYLPERLSWPLAAVAISAASLTLWVALWQAASWMCAHI